MEEPRRLGGRYELGSVLGRGGMAEVYLAHDTRLGRTVAVKTLRVDLARDPSFQARFRREAQSAASLNHPSIVAVYDTGEDYVDGVSIPYIVMEYVDGSTLRELLHSGRKLLPERSLEMTVGILQALEYSHRAGIVHRDIKPANVMLTRTGQVKVMDFGIARAMGDSGMTMTQTAAVIGTAQYLSPEQAKGEQVDARSDLYSTGCLLYELLTVRPPFVGDSPVAVAYQHVREEPQPPSVYDPEVTPAMDAIVLKALTKDPNYRYQSADEMRADVEAALDGQPVGATAAMGAAGYGYPHGYGDGAATTAMPPQQDSTSMLPPMREDDGGYGYDDRPDRRRQKKSGNTSTVLLVIAGVLVLIGAIFLGKALFGGSPASGGSNLPNFVNSTLSDAQAKAAERRPEARPGAGDLLPRRRQGHGLQAEPGRGLADPVRQDGHRQPVQGRAAGRGAGRAQRQGERRGGGADREGLPVHGEGQGVHHADARHRPLPEPGARLQAAQGHEHHADRGAGPEAGHADQRQGLHLRPGGAGAQGTGLHQHRQGQQPGRVHRDPGRQRRQPDARPGRGRPVAGHPDRADAVVRGPAVPQPPADDAG